MILFSTSRSPDNRKKAGILIPRPMKFLKQIMISQKQNLHQIFKTIVDPFIGKYSLIKVCSGVIKNDDSLYNVDQETEEESSSKLYVFEGSRHRRGSGTSCRRYRSYRQTESCEVLVTPFLPRITRSSMAELDTSDPVYIQELLPQRTRGDDDKVAQALAKIMQEDLTMKAVNDSENRQTLLYGMGDQHLDIIISKILTKYKD